MEKTRLEQLRGLKLESKQLEKKVIERLEAEKGISVGDTYGDYRTGFKKVKAQTGIMDPVADKYIQKIRNKKRLIDAEILELEVWLDEIKDSTSRTILRAYYDDGMTQEEIASMIGYERSNISRIIEKLTD